MDEKFTVKFEPRFVLRKISAHNMAAGFPDRFQQFGIKRLGGFSRPHQHYIAPLYALATCQGKINKDVGIFFNNFLRRFIGHANDYIYCLRILKSSKSTAFRDWV